MIYIEKNLQLILFFVASTFDITIYILIMMAANSTKMVNAAIARIIKSINTSVSVVSKEIEDWYDTT